MPYITVDDIKTIAPSVEITATSKPNIGQVGQIITQTERTTNAELRGLGFKVPIDSVRSPESFSIVKDIVLNFALADILRARAFGQQRPGDIGSDDAWKKARGVLDKIRHPDDPFTLTDAEIGTADIKASPIGTDDYISASGTREIDSPIDLITRDTRF